MNSAGTQSISTGAVDGSVFIADAISALWGYTVAGGGAAACVQKTINWRGVRRDTTANTSSYARSITHRRNRVSLLSAALMRHRLRNPGCTAENIPAIFCAPFKKEGFGRITTPVNGRNYIRYNGSDSYAFASNAMGGGGVLVPRYSAAMTGGHGSLRRGAVIDDEHPRAAENLREQQVEDHGHRRRTAAMADRLLFRRR